MYRRTVYLSQTVMGTHWYAIGALILAFGTFVQSYTILFPKDPPTKPGQCPRFITHFPTGVGCNCDQDCPGDDKCCNYQCGSFCLHPDFIRAECPKPSGVGTCDEKCQEDKDCCCGRRCCSNGCGLECMIPKIVKPGHCGLWSPHECGDFCKDDGYCTGDKKCCPSFCGNFCKDPI
ncbi:WAP four-disulfide core domain protein 3 [Girardinichthys multiradiatus]|uniref:WAP four-disulfide core domain protein 3 n=1 Tax=Girardinichthys multiradiatus TaxID=208333 RepID=UPI001FAD094F|nr:WAP four-disulfide core domain protein 3 [Girardinichthys multiradiatus]